MARVKEYTSEGVSNQESFRKRMEAQCSQIERYRAKVMYNEGRFLSQNEAATEWIARYAKVFDNGYRCVGL